MDTEIELKYLVLGDNIPALITNLLTQQHLSFTRHSKVLKNCYFDTPDLQLRQADIGLRVRQNEHGHIEQTIKTSGTVMGGLHQRPEYNITIDSLFPDLHLFDYAIWPEHLDVMDVQDQLTKLFDTDFTRTAWLITCEDDSVVELAFDQGEISTSLAKEDILEIELELISGDSQSLFRLAKVLMAELTLRPGILSKAARGYSLVFGVTEPHVSSAYTTLELNEDMSLIRSFKAGFAECLQQLQQLVSQFIETPNLHALKEISDALALARQGLWLYKEYLPEASVNRLRKQIKFILTQLAWVETAKQIRELTTKTGNYRKKVEYSEGLLAELKSEKHQLPELDDMVQLFHQYDFNLLQVDMLQLILSDIDETSDDTSLLDLAPSWLSISLDVLKPIIGNDGPLTAQQYLDNHHLVIRSLLTGNWFGELFDNQGRMEYRGPWLDIHYGIDELETLFLLKEHLKDSQQDMPQKLISWLDNKIENLLCALEHCRQAALALPPYWLR